MAPAASLASATAWITSSGPVWKSPLTKIFSCVVRLPSVSSTPSGRISSVRVWPTA